MTQQNNFRSDAQFQFCHICEILQNCLQQAQTLKCKNQFSKGSSILKIWRYHIYGITYLCCSDEPELQYPVDPVVLIRNSFQTPRNKPVSEMQFPSVIFDAKKNLLMLDLVAKPKTVLSWGVLDLMNFGCFVSSRYVSFQYSSFFETSKVSNICVTSNGNKLEIVANQMYLNINLDMSTAY